MKKYLKTMICFTFMFVMLFITKIDSKAYEIKWDNRTITWTSSGKAATNGTIWRVTAWDISCTVDGKTYVGRFYKDDGYTEHRQDNADGTVSVTREITEQALLSRMKSGKTALTKKQLDDKVEILYFNAIISVIKLKNGKDAGVIASGLTYSDWWNSDGSAKPVVGGISGWSSRPEPREHWNMPVEKQYEYVNFTVKKGTGCASVYNASDKKGKYKTSDTLVKYKLNTTVYYNGKASNGYQGYANGQELLYSSFQSKKLTEKKNTSVTLDATPNTFTLKLRGNNDSLFKNIMVKGATEGVANLPMKYGTQYEFKVTNPSATGKTFKGWNTSKNQTESNISVPTSYMKKGANDWAKNYFEIKNGIAEHSDKELILYPAWVLNTFTLNVKDSDGSALTSKCINGSYNTLNMAYGTEYTITINNPTKDGHTFKGWSKTQGGPVDSSLNVSTPTKKGANAWAKYFGLTNGIEKNSDSVTLYAVWQPNTLTVITKDNNGNEINNIQLDGGVATSEVKLSYTDTKKLCFINIPKAGCEFLGWSTTQGSSEIGTGLSAGYMSRTTNSKTADNWAIHFGLTNGIKDGSKTVTIYPVWSSGNKGNINYRANGGKANTGYKLRNDDDIAYTTTDEEVLTEVAMGDTDITLYAVDTLFKRDGYFADGWILNVGGVEHIIRNNTVTDEDTINKIKEQLELATKSGTKITLYANWIQGQSTLTINPNGGTWKGNTSAIVLPDKHGETMSITDPVPPADVNVTFDANSGKIVKKNETRVDSLIEIAESYFTGWNGYDSNGIVGNAGTYDRILKEFVYGIAHNGTGTLTAEYNEKTSRFIVERRMLRSALEQFFFYAI